MSQLLGSAEATLNGGSAGAELPVCSKAKPRLKQTGFVCPEKKSKNSGQKIQKKSFYVASKNGKKI